MLFEIEVQFGGQRWSEYVEADTLDAAMTTVRNALPTRERRFATLVQA